MKMPRGYIVIFLISLIYLYNLTLFGAELFNISGMKVVFRLCWVHFNKNETKKVWN